MTERKLTSTNYQNQAFLEERCALNELLYFLSKRWMTDVLFSIEEGNTRFTLLKENLEHISDHILADRLRALEQHQLIQKRYLPGNPPRTEYALTPKGNKLSEMLDGLCGFASLELEL